jgi:endogenous inhibitor of DNA gyrase (YacG/DUF329 family)
MTIRTQWEVICDGCGETVEWFQFKPLKSTLREKGILFSNGKHFCCERCKVQKLKQLPQPPKGED